MSHLMLQSSAGQKGFFGSRSPEMVAPAESAGARSDSVPPLSDTVRNGIAATHAKEHIQNVTTASISTLQVGSCTPRAPCLPGVNKQRITVLQLIRMVAIATLPQRLSPVRICGEGRASLQGA